MTSDVYKANMPETSAKSFVSHVLQIQKVSSLLQSLQG